MEAYYLKTKQQAEEMNKQLKEMGYRFIGPEKDLVDGWEELKTSSILLVYKKSKTMKYEKGFSDPSLLRESSDFLKKNKGGLSYCQLQELRELNAKEMSTDAFSEKLIEFANKHNISKEEALEAYDMAHEKISDPKDWV